MLYLNAFREKDCFFGGSTNSQTLTGLGTVVDLLKGALGKLLRAFVSFFLFSVCE
jgi:hypothetical protein